MKTSKKYSTAIKELLTYLSLVCCEELVALPRHQSGALWVLHPSIFAWAGAALPTLIISSRFPILCTTIFKHQNYP